MKHPSSLLLLLAALLPPWLAPWPLALAGLFLVPLFALLGDTLGQALPLWARWGALFLGAALTAFGLAGGVRGQGAPYP